MFLAFVVGLVAVSGSAGLAATRDLTVMPKVSAGSIPLAGDYWALIVGIDKYRHVMLLETAARAATALRDLLVARNAEPPPRSEFSRGAGDEGGQFVFRLSSVVSRPAPARPSLPSEQLTQGQRRLSALDKQKRRLEAQAKQNELDRQIEKKKQQIKDKKKKLEVASLPSYSQPKELGREITGKDGVPMLLVPEGEFLYGDTSRRLSLPAFYMDKYEVSTAQYAKHMGATGATAPKYWETSVLVSHSQKPVVGVSWAEAEAYCRQYGKRLPTQQEWEKAARGTDGRKYSWGNDEPTSRHAKYNEDYRADWNGYATLALVESYEAGQGPYGLYHMVGNVYEWTSSNSSAGSRNGRRIISTKVIRGGSWDTYESDLVVWSWSQFEPGAARNSLGFRCAQDVR